MSSTYSSCFRLENTFPSWPQKGIARCATHKWTVGAAALHLERQATSDIGIVIWSNLCRHPFLPASPPSPCYFLFPSLAASSHMGAVAGAHPRTRGQLPLVF